MASPEQPLITSIPLLFSTLMAPPPMPPASIIETPSEASTDAISDLQPHPSGDPTLLISTISFFSDIVNTPYDSQ